MLSPLTRARSSFTPGAKKHRLMVSISPANVQKPTPEKWEDVSRYPADVVYPISLRDGLTGLSLNSSQADGRRGEDNRLGLPRNLENTMS